MESVIIFRKTTHAPDLFNFCNRGLKSLPNTDSECDIGQLLQAWSGLMECFRNDIIYNMQNCNHQQQYIKLPFSPYSGNRKMLDESGKIGYTVTVNLITSSSNT